MGSDPVNEFEDKSKNSSLCIAMLAKTLFGDPDNKLLDTFNSTRLSPNSPIKEGNSLENMLLLNTR
jgi:hypothetical protein